MTDSLLRPGALIGGALLVASAVAVVVVTKGRQRDAAAPVPSVVVVTSAAPSVSSEPPLALPILEAEPAVDAKLIPRLQMPFPAGFVVLCSQGNASEQGQTHSLPQNLHALDFSNRVLAEVPVVAAAAGTVAYVFERAADDDPDGGSGYGNQVRLLHEHGLFTLYAHLDRVSVRVGQRLAPGQKLGTMGRTGLAGDRHLHFSLHHGAIDRDGVPNTLAIPALVTRELDSSDDFHPRASGELRCSSTKNPWSGAIYASDNQGTATPRAVGPNAQEAEAALRRSVARRALIWDLSQRVPYVTSGEYRSLLEPLLTEAPEDPVTQYTWAVEVELPARRFQAAKKHLDLAEKSAKSPALFEPWLAGWIAARRGTIALMQSRPDEAQRHFEQASELLPIDEIDAYIQRERARFLPGSSID
jgi:murein DD-endopeptidase MepM/ murein hydrolase activator NlpD